MDLGFRTSGVPPDSIAIYAGVGVVCFFLLLWHGSRVLRRRDPREPPYIHSTLPLIGHLVGMVRYGAKYFELVKYGTRALHPHYSPLLTDTARKRATQSSLSQC